MMETVLAGLGLAGQIFGAIGEAKNAKKQASLNRAAIRVQQEQANSNYGFSVKESALSQQEQAVRQRLAQMEILRARRDLIRNSQLARATAVSRAASSGAQYGSSLVGALGDINVQTTLQSAEIGTNAQASAEQFRIKNSLFDLANAQGKANSVFGSRLAKLQEQGAQLQGSNATYSAIGQIGTSLFNNAGTIANTGKSIGGLFSNTGT